MTSSLKKIVTDYLLEHLTLNNCVQVLNLVDNDSKGACLFFVDLHSELAMKLGKLNEMNLRSLISLFQRDSFFAKESDIFNAICGWIRYNKGVDGEVIVEKPNLKELLLTVRWNRLNGVIQSSDFKQEDLDEAKKNHPNKTSRIHYSKQDALFYSAEHGYLASVIWAIKSGASVFDSDNFDWTALHHSSRNGHLKVTKYLVEQGANISNGAALFSWCEDHVSPLHLAAYGGHLEIVKYLIGKQANVHHQTPSRRTTLHFGSSSGNSDIVKYLVDVCSVDKNATDQGGKTALHYCSYAGRIDIVIFLLAHGLLIDAENGENMTALHLSSQYGHLEVVKRLILNNANRNKVNSHGETPAKMAIDNGYYQIAHLLSKTHP